MKIFRAAACMVAAALVFGGAESAGRAESAKAPSAPSEPSAPPAPSALSAAAAAFERGKSHAAKYEWDAAIAAFEEALSFYSRTAGQEEGMAAAMSNIGAICIRRGEYHEALQRCSEALKIRETLPDAGNLAQSLRHMGLIYNHMGQYEEAKSFYTRALTIRHASGHVYDEGLLLNSLGILHYHLGDYTQAVEHIQRSLALLRGTDGVSLAYSMNALGAAHAAMGDYGMALRVFEKSAALLLQAGEEAGAAYLFNNMGLLYGAFLGQYQEALRLYQRALARHESYGDKTGVAITMENMGNVYAEWGQYSEALNLYETSLRSREEAGDKAGVAQAMLNLGALCHRERRYDDALAWYRKALAIKEAIGDKSGVAYTLSRLAGALAGNGDHGAAEEAAVRGLAVAHEVKSPDRLYHAHAALGAAYAAQMRNSEFGMRNKDGESDDAVSGIPHSAFAIPHSKALRHFRSAIETAESMRSLFSESEHKSGFLGTKLGAYEGLVELLLDTGARDQGSGASKMKTPLTDLWSLTSDDSANAEAFAVAERMKARSFLDELGAAKFARAGVSEELLQEKRLLEARMKWLRERQ